MEDFRIGALGMNEVGGTIQKMGVKNVCPDFFSFCLPISFYILAVRLTPVKQGH